MSLSGYYCDDSSYVRSENLNRYTNSTSSKRFGATGGYTTGYAVRATFPSGNTDIEHIRTLSSDDITSITMKVTCSGVGYDITTRYGELTYSSGNARIDNGSKTTTVSKNSTSKTLTVTSFGIPTYGYGFGGTVSSTSYGVISSIVVTIVTTENDYTLNLSYSANGGDNAPETQTYSGTVIGTPSHTFAIPDTVPTRTGYTFLGWATSASASVAEYSPEDEITIESNTTLYAVWELITYNVSYNKGAYGTGTNVTDTKDYGVNITLRNATFTRTGYTQTGWSVSDGGGLAYALGATYTSNADITLYPYWTIITYAVTYNKGANGSGTNVTDIKTYGTDLTLRDDIFTRYGYDQTGWSTTDGGAKVYDLEDTYDTEASVTLYPFWALRQYTVSYNKGSQGTGENTSATKTYGTPLTLLGATFTRTGYRQIGWSTTDGGSQNYALGGSYTNESSVTLYPVWTAYAVTIRYHANGATLADQHGSSYAIDGDGYITLNGSKDFQLVSYGLSAKPNNPFNASGINLTKTGYSITSGSEWNTASDGSGTTFSSSTTYTATQYSASVATSNVVIVLYANWNINTYTISYNANGGTGAPSAQTKTYGVDLTLSDTIPTFGSSVFSGWAESQLATDPQYQPSGTFTKNQNTVLYAVWSQSSFIRIMGSDGVLHSIPLYYMSSGGLVNIRLYKMGSDGMLHQQS